jgi:hypothetical protein
MAKDDSAKLRQTCFSCGTSFVFGMNQYDGSYVPRYKISVCRSCYQSNWDGWSPGVEAKLRPHLAAAGLPIPDRNAKGWLPRD